MAQVVASYIWYPSGYPGPAYDLTKVVCFVVLSDDPTKVTVRFRHQELSPVTFNKAAFFTAMGLP